MATPVSDTDFRNAMMRQARASIAAALIQAKVIDLSGANFYDPTAAANNPEVQRLKTAVDVVMTAVFS